MKDAPCSGFKVKLEVSMTYGGEIEGDEQPRSVSEYSKSFRLDHNQLGSISCLTPTCAAQNEFSDTLLVFGQVLS
jgi:hypothetical protein